MTLQERAASLTPEEIVALLESHQELTESHSELSAELSSLRQQLEWFRRQLFGSTSERRIDAPLAQMLLGEMLPTPANPVPTEEVPGYTRERRRPDKGPDSHGLRFDPTVPVEEIRIPDPEKPEGALVIGEKVTHRLAQRPASYVVKKYIREVWKHPETGKVSSVPAPASVLPGSYADVSTLACLLVDKWVYHLPLYRQHQRMQAAGVHVNRGTLTHWVQGAVRLLQPVYRAQVGSVLSSAVLLMDETPIKAGRNKDKGKMRTGYFWPIYGDRDEVVFPFYPTRAHEVVLRELGATFEGTLVTDGYPGYARYAERVASVVHAQCWVHVRRKFVQAEGVEPELAETALSRIRDLYRIEETVRQRGDPGKAAEYRALHSKPIVDTFFTWLKQVFEDRILLPSSPFTEAANYALEREQELRVFLADPAVPLDTNQVEREIRPVALGRKNWMFCWTEVGAEYAGIVQSLVNTCRLQGVDPYTYLVDVLQRIETHLAKDVEQLIPRLWKTTFADNPLPATLK